jgi:O-antigen/teichoic acid export membrane protein
MFQRIWRLRRVAIPLSWTTADQLLSALSNIVISLAVTRGAGLEGLGRFSLAFAAYLTVLGFSRALVSEPMLTVPGRDGDAEVERCGLTLTMLWAAGGALAVAGIGLVLGRVEFLVVAAAIPVLLAQDFLRYVAFRRHRAQQALALDAGWLLGSLLVWPVVSNSSAPTVGLACWAVAALLGLLAGARGIIRLPARPRVAVAAWTTDHRPVALPLAVDGLLVTLSLQGMVVTLVVVNGDEALGLLRACQIFFNPLGLLFTAVGLMAVPRLARRTELVTARLARRFSFGLAGLAGIACVVVVILQPVLNAVLYGGKVLAPGWLLIPLAVQVVLGAAAGGYFVVCKARRQGDAIVRCRLTSTVVGVVVLGPAILVWGLQGAAWVLVVQAAAYLVHMVIRTGRTAPDRFQPSTVVRTAGGRTCEET